MHRASAAVGGNCLSAGSIVLRFEYKYSHQSNLALQPGAHTQLSFFLNDTAWQHDPNAFLRHLFNLHRPPLHFITMRFAPVLAGLLAVATSFAVAVPLPHPQAERGHDDSAMMVRADHALSVRDVPHALYARDLAPLDARTITFPEKRSTTPPPQYSENVPEGHNPPAPAYGGQLPRNRGVIDLPSLARSSGATQGDGSATQGGGSAQGGAAAGGATAGGNRT
ncbi:hypothetical protein EIP91_002794 [Steccherinum ochraceum]|uniref:Uncharacterized protein n=1 Tax=Steccherinum ochraceum TaxID=92696 RepID=A0A4R0RN80_9APHY|nr:hypothetical protein EIP91_002794 [Steccherinum ochraceum]